MTDASMMDLFRMEVEQQGSTLNDALLSLEQSPTDAELLESAMRASHSLKGAARLVDVPPVVELAHRMEDCFVAAQEQRLLIKPDDIDACLAALDLIQQLSIFDGDLAQWQLENEEEKQSVCGRLDQVLAQEQSSSAIEVVATDSEKNAPVASNTALADMSMFELFQTELEQQGQVLNNGLLALENKANDAELLESLMRAAHSIKGAARLVGLQAVVELAHVIEDVFVAAQEGRVNLDAAAIDVLLQGSDLLLAAGDGEAIENWHQVNQVQYQALMESVPALLLGGGKLDVSPQVEHVESSAPDLNANVSMADMSMRDLFKVEVEQQGLVLSEGLLALEQTPASGELLDSLMRASHSIKGAARLIDLKAIVELAHVMEDVFVAAQNNQLSLPRLITPEDLNCLIKA